MTARLYVYEKAMPDISWDKKLLAAREAGFDGIELSIDETDARLARLDWDKDTRIELLKLSRSMDMPFHSMCLSGHRRYPLGSSDKSIESRGVSVMNKAIELADSLGIHTIQLAGYDVFYNEKSTPSTRERFIGNLEEAVRTAASFGIVLAMETMETTDGDDFINTVGKAMSVVNAVRSPYLQIYPDIGNLSNATDNILKDLSCGEGHIAAAHLKETVPGVFRNMMFGEGRVDFKNITAKLIALGVTRYTAEFWYNGGDNWQADLKAAHDFCRPLILK